MKVQLIIILRHLPLKKPKERLKNIYQILILLIHQTDGLLQQVLEKGQTSRAIQVDRAVNRSTTSMELFWC